MLMSDNRSGAIRARLGEILDEIATLPADEFAAKHRLNTEADGLRRELSSLDQDADTERAWAERAGRKASHSVDHEFEARKAQIVSALEIGGP